MYKLTAICPLDTTKKVQALLQEVPETSNILIMQAIDVVIGHRRTLRQWCAGELSLIELDLEVQGDLKQLDEDMDIFREGFDDTRGLAGLMGSRD